MSMKKSNLKVEKCVKEAEELSILDLPEFALECILKKLSPDGLFNMAGVCRDLRDRCRSNHLWERHMEEKWNQVIGCAAYQEWQWLIASKKDMGGLDVQAPKSWFGALSCVWSLSWIKSEILGGRELSRSLAFDSIMSFYMSLESGKFWFPAQVFNRQHGDVGFLLSCYDAVLSYDRCKDTFHARYPPHARQTVVMEEGVPWERVRAPPVTATGHNLHVSVCLKDLYPGDHIEIQWRRNKKISYGWWYGVVGHLESCDGSENRCLCHNSDIVILEFNQYTPGSQWRQAVINRNDHREVGNEADGYYGGIRKLNCKEEISMWKRLWPTKVLE